tara:strand:- start:932 stop:1432 length:501 start_codon:yes stop_codon:yes gene_type:complete
MGLGIHSLPTVFALAAWQRIAQEIDAPPAVKESLEVEVLRLHESAASQRDFVRAVRAVLHGHAWKWPRGRYLLVERLEEEPLDDDYFDALYHWFTSSAHQLYRRGQIRAALADGGSYTIRLSVADQLAPCGAEDSQELQPTKEVLERLPPCNHPFCTCNWLLKRDI